MIKLNAKIKDTKKKKTIICPNCSKEGNFPVFIKYIEPALFGMKLPKFHKEKAIICPHCGNVIKYK